MPYKVAIAHDNEIDLAKLVPQGRTEDGIQHPRRVYVPGDAYPDGEAFVNLAFSVTTRAEKQALDAQFGVSETVLMAECTMTLLKNDDTWGNFNVKVEYPEIGKSAKRSQFGWTVTYIIHIIEEL